MDFMAITPIEFFWVIGAFGIPIIVGFVVASCVGVIAKRGGEQSGRFAQAISMPIQLFGWLGGFYWASIVVRRLKFDWNDQIIWSKVDQGAMALATLAGFFLAYRLLLHAARLANLSAIGDRASLLLIRKIVTALFAVLAAITVLGQFGINIGPVLASLGVAGLAVALGLQDTISNYFAGLWILLDKPFQPGHRVRLESGQQGTVETIGWRTTRLIDGEKLAIVPNTRLTTTVVVNEPDQPSYSTISVEWGVAYGNDLSLVEALAERLAKSVLFNMLGQGVDSSVRVHFYEFGESNVLFRLTVKCKVRCNEADLQHELIKALHKGFMAGNIRVNFPTRQIITVSGQDDHPQSMQTGDVI